MKTLKFFAAALAIVAAASCVEVEDNPTGENNRGEAPVELVPVSFTATIDSPVDPSQSKTTLADDGVSVHWSEGDQILLYKSGTLYYYANNRSTLTASSISESDAAFEDIAISADTYNAIYPSDVADLTKWRNPYNWLYAATLSSQNVRPNNFSTTSWGVSNIAFVSGVANGEKLEFKNILAHFKFSIATAGVRSIEIKASSAKDNENQSCDLGGTLVFNYTTNTIGVYTSESITVGNNGSDFVVGETYYVAIPPVNMTGGLTFTFKDASGNTLQTLTRSSAFKVTPNTIYNLGSLSISGEVEPEDALTLSTTSVTVPPEGGSVTLTISTNNDWTLDATQDWLTISPTSGGAGDNQVITITAPQNLTGANLYKSVEVKSGSLTRYFSVNQAKVTAVYSLGEQVSGADAMENGAYYVILRQGSSVDYLAVNNNGQLIVSAIPDVNKISNVNIFVYHKDDTKEVTDGTSYGQTCAGTLQSLYNGGYIDKDLKVSSTAQYMTFGSHWDDSDPNIDIYMAVYTQNTSALDYYQFITYIYPTLYWKKSEEVKPNNLRKWYFYKVNPVSE